METASDTAERLRKAVSNYALEVEGQRCSLTISIGVAATQRDDLADMQDLLADVDESLTRARDEGGNQVVVG